MTFCHRFLRSSIKLTSFLQSFNYYFFSLLCDNYNAYMTIVGDSGSVCNTRSPTRSPLEFVFNKKSFTSSRALHVPRNGWRRIISVGKHSQDAWIHYRNVLTGITWWITTCKVFTSKCLNQTVKICLLAFMLIIIFTTYLHIESQQMNGEHVPLVHHVHS